MRFIDNRTLLYDDGCIACFSILNGKVEIYNLEDKKYTPLDSDHDLPLHFLIGKEIRYPTSVETSASPISILPEITSQIRLSEFAKLLHNLYATNDLYKQMKDHTEFIWFSFDNGKVSILLYKDPRN